MSLGGKLRIDGFLKIKLHGHATSYLTTHLLLFIPRLPHSLYNHQQHTNVHARTYTVLFKKITAEKLPLGKHLQL